MPRSASVLVRLAGVLLGASSLSATLPSPVHPPAPVTELRLELAPDAIDRLRQHPRRDVPARLRVGAQDVGSVTVHLKGRTGSFRPVDDTPSWTVDGSEPGLGRRFHLNNAVEDPSLLCAWLGGEVFRELGFPTPAMAHARVFLNGRPLGLYVWTEAFSPEFLVRECPAGSRLYEPAPGADVMDLLELRAGPAEAVRADRAMLAAVADALQEPDPARRGEALSTRVDVESFATFQALEVLLAHRDGYALARNNYRILFPGGTDRIQVLPAGMDQLFQPPDLPWNPAWGGALSRALSGTEAGRAVHEARCRSLFGTILAPGALEGRVRNQLKRLEPGLTAGEIAGLRTAVEDLCDRIRRRRESLEVQFGRPPVPRAQFIDGVAGLGGWVPRDVPEGGVMDRKTAPDGTRCLRIVAGPVTFAAWTTDVSLDPGRYRFEARVRLAGVRPLPFGQHQGVALRRSGEGPRSAGKVGDGEWMPMELEFEVRDRAEGVTLRAELRASAGEVWFGEAAFRLIPR